LQIKRANLRDRVIDTCAGLLKQHVLWTADPDFYLTNLNVINELAEIGFPEGWWAITLNIEAIDQANDFCFLWNSGR
jgi:hypothetical protein